ncbi:hypothetical protein HQ393_06865 [Chitinibacter bivalviorum]|uniref:Uncharacterized protein n=1 Tax=Chitinibacter bivalviorum TaxID=2739434 RepID=A0A7H9BI36_9NEIS|nr:hypothetical protein [Chitinibacter bivalviorum]QLG88002.1 hypothetical protein HQ393_06865 [Chitinibacter bivalviorum]
MPSLKHPKFISQLEEQGLMINQNMFIYLGIRPNYSLFGGIAVGTLYSVSRTNIGESPSPVRVFFSRDNTEELSLQKKSVRHFIQVDDLFAVLQITEYEIKLLKDAQLIHPDITDEQIDEFVNYKPSAMGPSDTTYWWYELILTCAAMRQLNGEYPATLDDAYLLLKGCYDRFQTNSKLIGLDQEYYQSLISYTPKKSRLEKVRDFLKRFLPF